jgi:hypothetical protein
MASVTLSGADTIILNDRVFADLADGDCAKLDFPNELANVKTGKNGNSIYGFNETGKQANFSLRLLRGSADDKFLNGLLAQQSANFAGFTLLKGEFIKKLGDGQGAIASDTYVVSGGIFAKQVPASTNTEGNTDQSVAVYEFKFANAPRSIT